MINRKAKNLEDGFTLIELLVVILVIGVLSGIVVLAVSNSTGDAKAKACTQNAVNLLAALDTYKATPKSLDGGEGSYPASTSTAAGAGDFSGYVKFTYADTGTNDLSVLVPKFIKKLPSASEVQPYYNSSKDTVAVAGLVTGCKNAGV